jgi:hypothetical protein
MFKITRVYVFGQAIAYEYNFYAQKYIVYIQESVIYIRMMYMYLKQTRVKAMR